MHAFELQVVAPVSLTAEQLLRLERGAEGAERRTVVWCARKLDWLPVKVEYREKDGSVTTALLRSFTQP